MEDRGARAVPMSAFERRRQRALAECMLGILRPGPGVVRGGFSDRLVAWAVVLSTLDDPPLNAYKIAELTGLPDTTVKRCLSRLVAQNVAVRLDDKSYIATRGFLERPQRAPFLAHIESVVTTAARKLKGDTDKRP